MKLSCRYTNVLYYFVAYYKTILMISIMESTGGFQCIQIYQIKQYKCWV